MLHTSADALTDRARSALPRSDSAHAGDSPTHVVLVADRFAQFADGEGVLTVSQFRDLVPAGASGEDRAVCVGQGIERSDIESLTAAGVINGRAGPRLVDPGAMSVRPVSPATVHKRRAENVLLAGLRPPSRSQCSAYLRIHKDNELLMDHQTGRHLPGMVIIEALRQICTAQFETVYRFDLPPTEYAGLWNRIDVGFENFLFPLSAEVSSEITEFDLSRRTNLRFRATAAVRQCGSVVASADIEYSMVPWERMEVLERLKATRAARVALAGCLERGAD